MIALETVRIALDRVRIGRPTKSILMVGLRGVGKTVLLDRMRDNAEATGIPHLARRGPEGRSLPASLAPGFETGASAAVSQRKGQSTRPTRPARPLGVCQSAQGEVQGHRGGLRPPAGAWPG